MNVQKLCNLMMVRRSRAKMDDLDYLCFESLEDSNTLFLNKSIDSPHLVAELEYKGADGVWHDYTWTGTAGQPIHMAAGDKVWWRAKSHNETFSYDNNAYYTYTSDKRVMASGSIMSLRDKTLQNRGIPSPCYFLALFFKWVNLVKLPLLDWTNTTDSCCRSFASGCSGIESNVQLPDCGEISYAAYYQAFLSASVSGNIDLSGKFVDAYGLGKSFWGTNIKSASLKIEKYGERALVFMFKDCSKLNHITVNLKSWTDESGEPITPYWVENVSKTGVFTCPSDLPRIFDASHIPVGWEVINV